MGVENEDTGQIVKLTSKLNELYTLVSNWATAMLPEGNIMYIHSSFIPADEFLG